MNVSEEARSPHLGAHSPLVQYFPNGGGSRLAHIYIHKPAGGGVRVCACVRTYIVQLNVVCIVQCGTAVCINECML